MPAPKVASVDAFFAKLAPAQRPHLEALRALCLAEARKAGLVEALKWNFPAYAPASGTGMAWTIQCFSKHCSLRFPVRFFADHRAGFEAAGYEAIEGAVKLPFERPLPKTLLTKVLRARVRDVEAGNLAWSEPAAAGAPKAAKKVATKAVAKAPAQRAAAPSKSGRAAAKPAASGTSKRSAR